MIIVCWPHFIQTYFKYKYAYLLFLASIVLSGMAYVDYVFICRLGFHCYYEIIRKINFLSNLFSKSNK